MESKPNGIDEAHVVVMPFPIQGHINPMLQFCKQLASRGLKVTFATTSAFSSKFTHSQPPNINSYSNSNSNSILIETISDGSDFDETTTTKNPDTYIERFDVVGRQSLTQLIEDKFRLGHNVKCVVYDSSIPWALDVARKFGVYGASFFTQTCLVNLIYYQVYEGLLKAPIDGPWQGIITNGTPLIEARDMPSFVTHNVGLPPALRNLVLNQFSNYSEADWRFFNTIDALECEVINWMQTICTVKTIGPCIPSKYLDNRIPNDTDYGLSLFLPETDVCIKWLDSRQSASVVYVSMGSMASLGDKQMEEVAQALSKTNKSFLWVVRACTTLKISTREVLIF